MMRYRLTHPQLLEALGLLFVVPATYYLARVLNFFF